jgi:hypothetical protein
MEHHNRRLEEILATLAADQKKKDVTLVGFLDSLHPLIKVLAPCIGAFLWFQGNFATIRMYQEQDVKLLAIDARFEKQYKEVKELIDQRHNESIAHSNDNRDRTLALLAEIKDSLKTLFLDRQIKR